MEMLSTGTVMSHFTQVGPSYQRNQQRRLFAKSALHPVTTLILRVVFKTKQPITGPPSEDHPDASASSRRADKPSDAESSSSLASSPVVCSQYQLSMTYTKRGVNTSACTYALTH